MNRLLFLLLDNYLEDLSGYRISVSRDEDITYLSQDSAASASCVLESAASEELYVFMPSVLSV